MKGALRKGLGGSPSRNTSIAVWPLLPSPLPFLAQRPTAIARPDPSPMAGNSLPPFIQFRSPAQPDGVCGTGRGGGYVFDDRGGALALRERELELEKIDQ